MKMTTGTAMQLLLEANPVPGDAFADAARDARGRATLAAIFAGSLDSAELSGAPAGRRLRRRVLTLPRWRFAIPVAAMTAALAAGLAIALALTGSGGAAPAGPPEPAQTVSGALATLVADLTAQPAGGQGDAGSELRRLANVAAAQPAPALGPVEYSSSENWGLDLGKDPHGLSYRSHNTNSEQDWVGADGASLSIRTWPGGKVPLGNIPVGRSGPSAQGAANFKLQDPATLPTTESGMRQRLLQLSCPGTPCTSEDQADDIVKEASVLMGSEPLPPAARAAMLRVLADTAASPGPQRAFFDLGSVQDRAGHKAVAIAFEDAWSPPPQCPGSSSITFVSGSSPGAPGKVICGPKATSAPGSHPTLPPKQPELWVLVVDPGSGALLGLEFAYCKGPVGSHLAAGSCSPESYAQYLEIKAVASIPPTPTAPPSTNTP